MTRRKRNVLSKIVGEATSTRLNKTRSSGLTMVIDRRLGVLGTEDFCNLNSEHFEFWKIGFGTAAVTPAAILKKKIQILTSYSKKIFPGGTLFESAFCKNKVEEYINTCRDLGFTAIEISDGTVEVPQKTRFNSIKIAKKIGLKVFTEVGNKDPSLQASAQTIAKAIIKDRQEGADFVIMEGRESGKRVGIFNDVGKIRSEYFDKLEDLLDDNVFRSIIWEAPLSEQQIFLLKRIGADANLGNINPDDVLGLETLRRGLRWDTFEQKNRKRSK